MRLVGSKRMIARLDGQNDGEASVVYSRLSATLRGELRRCGVEDGGRYELGRRELSGFEVFPSWTHPTPTNCLHPGRPHLTVPLGISPRMAGPDVVQTYSDSPFFYDPKNIGIPQQEQAHVQVSPTSSSSLYLLPSVELHPA